MKTATDTAFFIMSCAQCLNQKAAGRGENGDFENRSAAYIKVREHRKRRNCHLQTGMATFRSDT